MIYTNIKFTAGIILVAVLLTSSYARPPLSLKDKLARLLMDPENDDMNNEIFDRDDDWQSRNDRLRGMLLQNSRETNRMLKNNFGLKNLFKNIKAPYTEEYFDDAEEATTPKTTPPTQARTIVMAMAPIKSMVSQFFDMLRSYSN